MKLPEVKFLLKNRGDTKTTLINMVARYQNQKLVYSTGTKILPSLWDFENQRPTLNKSILKKHSSEKEVLKDTTLILNQYQSSLDEIFRAYKVKRSLPSPDQIKEELNRIFNKKAPISKKKDLFQFIDEFILSTRKRPFTIKGYRTTFNHLKSFNNQYKRKIDFDTIDLDFYDDFIKYFQEKDYAVNTIGKNVKNIKVFMNEATERELNTNMAYRSKRFKVPEETTGQIYLTEKEIELLYKLDLDNNPRLDKARDIFVVACHTGLRFSDLNQIKEDNIVEDGRLLKVKTQKTGEDVVIPVMPEVKKILYKREGHLPRIMSNQKLNSYIKELGLMAGITEKVPVSITKGGLRTSSSIPKYKLITVHTARRSFASNAYLGDVPVISIMKITGHKTEKSFMKYIRISKEDNARKLLDHPFFQSKSHLKIS